MVSTPKECTGGDMICSCTRVQAGAKAYRLQLTTVVDNKSLARASVELVGVTQFKTDVSDPTTGMSILIVGGYNAFST